MTASAPSTVLIKGVLLYGEGEPVDVLLADGQIAEIGTALTADDAEVIEAAGHILLPGLVEALGSKRVLVLAPTLLLVKQLRDEWMRERTSTWATLAVCSDIGTDEGDDSTHVSPGELGSKPTTDPAKIASEISVGDPPSEPNTAKAATNQTHQQTQPPAR